MSGPAGKPEPGLERFVLELPKVELHVHLEGALGAGTLLKLARRRGVELPATTEEGLAEWYRFRDFDHFVEIYLAISRCLRDPEDFQLMVEDFLAEQARQNVFYTEAHFTISTHWANGVNTEEVAVAMAEAIAVGERRWGTRLKLIPDIVRNEAFERADMTIEWALDHRDRGVVALGIAGMERYPSEPFRQHFATAKAEGLHRVAHAGEQCGPESIRAALVDCDPERLGHGIRAVDDSELLERLAAVEIPVEVCPSSNVCLGLAESHEAHPFGEMRRAGLELSLNSDDPPLFGTDLVSEYVRAAEAFDLSPRDLADLALAAVRHSFLDDEEKARRLAELPGRYDELAREILGRGLED